MEHSRGLEAGPRRGEVSLAGEAKGGGGGEMKGGGLEREGTEWEEDKEAEEGGGGEWQEREVAEWQDDGEGEGIEEGGE